MKAAGDGDRDRGLATGGRHFCLDGVEARRRLARRRAERAVRTQRQAPLGEVDAGAGQAPALLVQQLARARLLLHLGVLEGRLDRLRPRAGQRDDVRPAAGRRLGPRRQPLGQQGRLAPAACLRVDGDRAQRAGQRRHQLGVVVAEQRGAEPAQKIEHAYLAPRLVAEEEVVSAGAVKDNVEADRVQHLGGARAGVTPIRLADVRVGGRRPRVAIQVGSLRRGRHFIPRLRRRCRSARHAHPLLTTGRMS
jgi:hypothetical protein